MAASLDGVALKVVESVVFLLSNSHGYFLSTPLSVEGAVLVVAVSKIKVFDYPFLDSEVSFFDSPFSFLSSDSVTLTSVG